MSASKEGVINIHGRAYQTVALRVHNFRESKPDWSITTELVSVDAETVIIKASIADPTGRVIGTGYAEERRNASTINKTSALENCETSAIGRALAACGHGGTEYASANEVENAIHQQRNTSVRAAVLEGVAIDEEALNEPQAAIREALKQEDHKEARILVQDAVRGLDGDHKVALFNLFDSKERARIKELMK